MREISVKDIIPRVRDLCMDANYNIPHDVKIALKEAYEREESKVGKDVIAQILKNHEVSESEKLPLCQDTGFAVFFVSLGEDVHIVDGNIKSAIEEGVRQGYIDGYLRKSIVTDPVFDRKNTKDNTPAIVHIDIVPGDRVKIVFAPKGGGSENMSTVKMMKPADGINGIKDFAVEWVSNAGGNPCPPTIVGIGIGGTFEYAAYLAKKALLRPIGKRHFDERYAKAELEILERINRTGTGPMGLGGSITSLDVHIEIYPCHIASMPVAINLNCHAARHKEITI